MKTTVMYWNPNWNGPRRSVMAEIRMLLEQSRRLERRSQ